MKGGRALLLGGVAGVAIWAAQRGRRHPRRRSLGRSSRLPRPLKVAHTAATAVLVPLYWRCYGPRNFLWFSDIAQIALPVALWMESPLLVGTMAVAVLPLEIVWNLDFLAGGRLVGLAAYMFDRDRPLWLRSLSLFHIALPPTLLWSVSRLGYDRRALAAQTGLAGIVLPVTYAVTEQRKNINWVFGFGRPPRTPVPRPLHLALLMIGLPLLVYRPTHRALAALFPPPG